LRDRSKSTSTSSGIDNESVQVKISLITANYPVLKEETVEETVYLSKLMAYCSREAHSCVEKAAMIGFVKLRILEPDENCSLRGDTLRQVIN